MRVVNWDKASSWPRTDGHGYHSFQSQALLLRAILCLLAVSIVFLIYLPAKDLPFQFDDDLFLSNDNVKLGRWRAFLWPLKTRPLTWISFLVQYRIHGPNAGPYHLVNVVLHALNSLLVLLLLTRILELTSGRRDRVHLLSLAGALIFALHPLQSEATLYIYQRSTLLGGLFTLLTLLTFWHNRPRLTLVLLLLALLSKEFTVVLPVVLWFMNGFLRKRWRPDRWLVIYFSASVLAGLVFLIWILVSGERTLGVGFETSSLYAATQLKVIWSYIGLTLFPISLNLDYHVYPQTDFQDPVWWIALLGLGGFLVLTFRLRSRCPEAAFLVFLFFAFLLPTSSFIYSQDYMFEHRVYTSLLGFSGLAALALGAGWRLLEHRLGPTKVPQALPTLLIGVTVSVPLVAYAGVDRERLQVWRDEVSLWRDTARKSPDKYRPHYNLGVSLIERSPREAVSSLARAIAIDPHLPFAYRSLADVCLDLGNYRSAEHFWERALKLNPHHARTHLALGRLHALKPNYFPAYRHLKRAQALDPQDWRSYFHLAQLYFRFGFWDKTLIQSEMGWNRSPHHLGLRLLRADSVARLGNWDRAVELYQELLQSEPANSSIYYKLAQAYGVMRQPERALETARQGLEHASAGPESRQGRLLIEQLLSQGSDGSAGSN